MSNGFLKRWSRRKTADVADAPKLAPEAPVPQAAEARPPHAPAGIPVSETARSGPATSAGAPNATEEPIDPATLPPLESLGADSDYTVFLKRGVPEALRNAALRKAWMSDPFIRDFRGPAEYALDYTTAEFDLRPTDDVAKMLDQIFPPAQTAASVPPESQPKIEPPALESVKPPPPVPALPDRAATNPAIPAPAPAEPESEPVRRKHGGALPS